MAKEKKKILFVCQYFYPEVFRGNDVAFHLAEEGHEVHVVTGIPVVSSSMDMVGGRSVTKW